MPGMDGMQVKARLNQDSLSASIPVIFLTAQSDVEDKVRGLGLGADDYVTKPFHAQELLARLDSALKRKGLYEDLAMTDGIIGLHNSIFFKKEFALFFFEQTKAAIDRLRKKIDETILNYRDVRGKILFFVSAGIAVYDQVFKNEPQMFDLADSRLYEEKKRKKVPGWEDQEKKVKKYLQSQFYCVY